jgi:hypothetical protein
MKKIIGLVAVLLLMATAMASAEPAGEHWVLQVQGGPGFSLSNTTDELTVNSPSWGFNGSVGFAASDAFSLSLLMGYQVSSVSLPPGAPPGVGASLAYTPLQGVIQYNLPGDGVRIYCLLGAGVALNNLSMDITVDGLSVIAEAIKETSFLLSPGLGVAIQLSDKTDLFVQGKLDIDFFSQKLADMFTDEFSDTKKFDTPQLFIPVQIGFKFSMN